MLIYVVEFTQYVGKRTCSDGKEKIYSAEIYCSGLLDTLPRIHRCVSIWITITLNLENSEYIIIVCVVFVYGNVFGKINDVLENFLR